MNRTESQLPLVLHDQTNRELPTHNNESMIKSFFCEKPVTTAGSSCRKEITPESSNTNAHVSRVSLSRRFKQLLTLKSPPKQASQGLETDTSLKLQALMPSKAFVHIAHSQKTTNTSASADFFDEWYNEKKSDPVLKEILINAEDTDIVKKLRRCIVQYELNAIEELEFRTNSLPPKYGKAGELPQCLKLKPKELFDKNNCYRAPDPGAETINPIDKEEVLTWYRQGLIDNPNRPGKVFPSYIRTLKNTNYSESEIARKLNAYLNIYEEQAVEQIKTQMPADAGNTFLSLLNEEPESAGILDISPLKPLVDWHNTMADDEPEYYHALLQHCMHTKASKAYRTFLAAYDNHAAQIFKKSMGESIYDSCYTQLPNLLPRDVMTKDVHKAPIDYLSREKSYLTNHLNRLNEWLGKLSDDQWQQLSRGKARNSYCMNWLRAVMTVLGPHCSRSIND